MLVGRRYGHLNSIFLARRYAETARPLLSKQDYDLIFAPAASQVIAFLETRIPIVYSSDSTFALMNNYYGRFSDLLRVSRRGGEILEAQSIAKASLLIYPSDWAARSAIEHYGAVPEKVHVIPYGANFEKIPPKETIFQKKPSKRCRLLFLGVDWQRKGGEIAFESFIELQQLGVDSELTVCGCTPPAQYSHSRMTVIPFLDKNNERDSETFAALLLMSDFLLLPTRSECYGIVFCEANAFGLPVITTRTGGVPGVVEDGRNGFMLPISAGGTEYARLIADIYRDNKRYLELRRSSRAAFDERLNWDAWGEAVRKLIDTIL